MEIFTIAVDNVAVSAAQDLLCAYAASTKKLQMLGYSVFANGQTTIGNYPIKLVRLVASVTTGSGGSVVTPNNVNPNGASPGFTARGNDTTLATGGSSVTIDVEQFNPITGNVWQPPVPVGEEPGCNLSDAFALVLESAPGGTINVSAIMWLREI